MTRDEYRQALDQLGGVIARALTHYAVWKKLRLHDPESVEWSKEQQTGILGRHHGFFTPVAIALLDMALIEFAKVFDTDPQTTSLTNLLRAGKRDSNLVSRSSAEDLRRISKDYKQYKSLVVGLRRKRNQQLAHADTHPDPVDPIMTADFDKLTDWIKSAFNTLAAGHDDSYLSWEHQLRTSEAQTIEVFRILLEDTRRRRQDYDKTMVEIGLGAAQDFEKLMGRRPSSKDIRSIVQSYGLSEEHMKRVEKEYRPANQGVTT